MSDVTQTPFHPAHVTLMSTDWRGASTFGLLGLPPALEPELPPAVSTVFTV